MPLVAAVVAELEKLSQDGERVFSWDMTRTWRTALRRAGLLGFRFHDLRHSAASMLVQSGANLSEVAQRLGHKDIRMTQRYSHIHSAHTLALIDRVMGVLPEMNASNDDEGHWNRADRVSLNRVDVIATVRVDGRSATCASYR